MKIYRNEMSAIPKFYGFSYFVPNQFAMVCYPMPFNFLVRWARQILCYLKCPRPKEFMPTENFEAGYRLGFEAGKRDVFKSFVEVSNAIEKTKTQEVV